MASISTRQRQSGESYIVSFNRPDGRKTTRTFRDGAEAEAFADLHGGWGRGVPGPRPRSFQDRLWERILTGDPDECWEWQGPVNKPGGYGYLATGGHASPKAYAHRGAYEVTYGPIPEGLVVRHKCDNPPCCNPGHLELGTPQENTDDMLTRRGHYLANRTHCANGHEFTPNNTRVTNSRRVCRSCERDAYHRKSARRSA